MDLVYCDIVNLVHLYIVIGNLKNATEDTT